MDREASLHVVDDAEVLPGLLDLDDIHEAGGELGVGPGLAVYLDQALLHDRLHLLHGEGILQTVPVKECQVAGKFSANMLQTSKENVRGVK